MISEKEIMKLAKAVRIFTELAFADKAVFDKEDGITVDACILAIGRITGRHYNVEVSNDIIVTVV